MSYRRMQLMLIAQVLPFNFGMTYEDWLKQWNEVPDMRKLIGSDPATWPQEQIDAVNEQAAKEQDLYDRMCSLSDEDFQSELKRLQEEQDNE